MPSITATLQALNAPAVNTRQSVAQALNRCDDVPNLFQIRDLCTKALALGLGPQETAAVALIRAFGEKGHTELAFRRCQRGRVAMQLLARVLDASTVNQGALGMCGPAAVVMERARNSPSDYAQFGVEMAETGRAGWRGASGNMPVAASHEILAHDVDGDLPQADWIVCASLRSDPASLQGEFNRSFYGGTSADELFDWLVGAGYGKVIAISHSPMASMIKAHPARLIPPTAGLCAKAQTLEQACALSAQGWQVFMMAYMSLSKTVEALHTAQAQRTAMTTMLGAPTANQVYGTALAKEVQKLSTPTPGAVGTAWNTVKALTIGSSSDTRHWTYVETMRLAAGNVTLTCFNHGSRFSMISIPREAFENKFIGFVAASDAG